MKAVEVRTELVKALKLDLVGPAENLGNPEEVLPQAPSRWYLTGFLVPIGAERSQRSDETASEDLDQAGETGGLHDDAQPERPAARQRYFPSSIGVSLLVPRQATKLNLRVSWGDYRAKSSEQWERKPRTETITVDLANAAARP